MPDAMSCLIESSCVGRKLVSLSGKSVGWDSDNLGSIPDFAMGRFPNFSVSQFLYL